MTAGSGSGRKALITGASAGIGRALADVFARDGFDLVLTARRGAALASIADDLTEKYGITAIPITADLSDPSAPGHIAEQLGKQGLQIDVLVNNAGYGVPGYFLTNSWDTHQKFLQVMMVAVSELTHILLPGMVARKYGRILNIASLAGLVPGSPGSTLYAAVKSFMIQFSQSLHVEVSRSNVHVCALCPGYTLSEFHDVNGTRVHMSKLPAFLWMDAKTVAEAGYDAVMAGKPVHVPGSVNKLIAGISNFLPHDVARQLIVQQSKRVRPKSPPTRELQP